MAEPVTINGNELCEGDIVQITDGPKYIVGVTVLASGISAVQLLNYTWPNRFRVWLRRLVRLYQ